MGPSDQNQMPGFDPYPGAHFAATCSVSGGAAETSLSTVINWGAGAGGSEDRQPPSAQ